MIAGGAAVGAPPEFVATDITTWTPAQLESLPFFKHYIPLGPGVPSNFTPVSRSASGFFAGSVPQSIPYTGSREAALVGSGGIEYIDPFGTYSWGYWSWDGSDWHYSFGYVRDSVAMDVNYAGVAVGKATLAHSGDYSSGARYHAYRYSAESGRVDLLPDSDQSFVNCINNRGEMGGYAYGTGPFVGGFRMAANGDITVLNPVNGFAGQPRWINASGVMIGSYYNGVFAAPSGPTTVALPSLGGDPRVVVNDLNDTAWIVGFSGPFGDPETYATLWEPTAGGDSWTPHDLTELLVTPDVLLESAVAIDNAGNIIALGHLDGTDLFSSRRYLLTPIVPLDPPCAPDIGIHPPATVDLCAGDDLELIVEIAGGEGPFMYRWQRDGVDLVDGPGLTGADSPVLTVSGVGVADSGVYRCMVQNACQSAPSNESVVTATACCPGDIANGDGLVDVDDLNAILSVFGTSVGVDDPRDTANDDGLIDVDDLNVVLANWGVSCE